jgi:hypothetical protein
MIGAKIYKITFTNLVGVHEEYVSSKSEQKVIEWCEKEAHANGCTFDWEVFNDWNKTIKVKTLDRGICNAG